MDDERTKHAAPLGQLRVHPDHEWRKPGGRPHPEAEIWGPDTEAVVAPGRSVSTSRTHYFGPGSKVTLPLSEVRRLQALGFLL